MFGLRIATVVPLVVRWVGTPFQIYIKRVTESNPTFRKKVAQLARWYNTKSVRLRYKVNNLERSEEQIKRAAQMSEDRAIILAAEVLSSTIGSAISISLIIWSYYHHLETQKEEKEKEENEIDEKISKIRDLINLQNEKLVNLQSSILSLESKIASIEKIKKS